MRYRIAKQDNEHYNERRGGGRRESNSEHSCINTVGAIVPGRWHMYGRIDKPHSGHSRPSASFG